jgi:hypothetical protein
MVTEDKIINSIMLRYRLGTILVWLGVFTWLPFIFLRAVGEKPPFFYFLPVHLISVVGGSRLRAQARKVLGLGSPRKNMLHAAGHSMIVLGILAWTPYLYLRLVVGQTAEVADFLPFHLIGVLGGMFLHVLSYVLERHRMQTA